MYINITDSETADNKGSSGDLVHYLDKENRLDKEKTPEYWFNHKQNDILSQHAQTALDHNIAKLSKTDAKFFLINISPSQKEMAWLKEKYRDLGAPVQLKVYAVAVMDEYAQNFKRPGIESGNDLLWFGKLEKHRYYSHKDSEVKEGLRKRGERKPGEQMHVQVIVSRKDITNKIKLSPMNKSRGKNAEHSKKLGQFNRSAFKSSGEYLFDQKFDFERGLTETFRYANAQKKGNLEDRLVLHAEKRSREIADQLRPDNKKQQQAIRQQPQTNLFIQPRTDFIPLSLGKYQPEITPGTTRKKKRKKGKEQDSGLSL